ncbi:TPA: PTS lactose/cellobiose transporter subunit IIA [Listeria monocytogenes]|uniref:PTS lactose/cellobiose transporter subunit IIA n=1 Tax=Listeria monocytogenes TaxID=1639 RepID=A0A5Y6ALK5_LISMN|nr:PTS lactose/cellobiose transporter subunit IIA [Listeria monocytogenes]EAE3765506.1 PTS lactose/cellobiose transporter subunit IIA [Listeria monocytogenes serotype 1/2b]EAF4458067.1 PTS lactose/cellobiose transporter subunit IIA [Listeria monocytogenes serotype 1/2a]EAG6254469.1 PTS lactose/cellobiose transporter subunit IIA [Listeria monocytogenes CFSAN003806]EAG6262510.1 PTS lactose/cellobiose transporter subunit IIA [Listeria monocytogenes CFSAN003725]EAG6332496.1 PTS lactose/cellobiose 
MEGTELQSFKIISSAGDASSSFLKAIRHAEKSEFAEAEACIEQANQSLREAHHVQTSLIQEEAGGDSKEVSLLLIHAQDHLMNAFVYCDLVKSVLNLYKRLDEK